MPPQARKTHLVLGQIGFQATVVAACVRAGRDPILAASIEMAFHVLQHQRLVTAQRAVRAVDVELLNSFANVARNVQVVGDVHGSSAAGARGMVL